MFKLTENQGKLFKISQIVKFPLLIMVLFSLLLGNNYNYIILACSSEENFNIESLDEFYLKYALGGSGQYIEITQDQGKTVQQIDLSNETFYDAFFTGNNSEMDEDFHNNIEVKPHLFLNFKRESNLIYNCSIELALLNYTFKGSVLFNLGSYCFIFNVNNKSTDVKLPFLVSPSMFTDNNFEFLTYDATVTPQVMVYSDFPSDGYEAEGIIFKTLLQKNVRHLLLNYRKQNTYLSGLASEGRAVFYEAKSYFLINGRNAFMGNAYALMIKAAIPEIVYLSDWTSPSFYVVDTNLPTSQESITNGINTIEIILIILIFIITSGIITIIWKRNKKERMNEKNLKMNFKRKTKNKRV